MMSLLSARVYRDPSRGWWTWLLVLEDSKEQTHFDQGAELTWALAMDSLYWALNRHNIPPLTKSLHRARVKE